MAGIAILAYTITRIQYSISMIGLGMRTIIESPGSLVSITGILRCEFRLVYRVDRSSRAAQENSQSQRKAKRGQKKLKAVY